MTKAEEFGKLLRKIRKEKGLTQAALAELIGMEKRTIGRYEKGQNKRVPDEFVDKVAKALNSEDLANFFYLYNVSSQYMNTLNSSFHLQSEKNDHLFKLLMELANYNQVLDDEFVEIKVYGKVPAGIPIEAIEDTIGTIEIPKKWTKGGKEFIGLEVQGDSMFPKYLPGDTVVIELTPDVESGQDVVVYVNGYEATLKTIQKNSNGTVSLVPINGMYPTMTYGPHDEPISVLGVVRELRRPI